MKIFFSIMLFVTFLTNITFSQNINSDEYILDTVYRRSTTDPSVIDTIITAKKRVVVKKEIVIENEIIIPPTFSKQSIHLFASRDFYSKPESEYLTANKTIQYGTAKGISVGGEFQTNIQNKLRIALQLAYSKYNVSGVYNYFISTPTVTNITVTDTIEVFYIGNATYYITEEVPKTIHDTIYSPANFGFTNRYTNIDFELHIGKLFEFDYVSLFPRISGGIRNNFMSLGYNAEKNMQQNNKTIHTYYFVCGLSCMISVPLSTHVRVDICPTLYLYNKKNNVANNLISKDYSISCGFNYMFN